ncbi:hypothetical protein CUMW_213580 [Citrus unshiu]|uniref:Carboxypeptidase n=1 Tax=Citrus unshiu TaxID=55188 RepID=A0A2H5QBG0_CITUN|nr:hypothetical protein CUMW_213580 [Citrus unshiu]
MAFWFFSLLLLFINKSCAELISALPGQPNNVPVKQYSGYILTDANHGRALFYYFVEAQSTNPLSLPLTLWLNGGPGCSSLGFGAFMEHGPFQPGENGQLLKNEYSWNLASNMLYVESPIGVGFSYSNTSSDYNLWNDSNTAGDNLRFIVNWLEEFPQYKDSEFFLTGESYAGHYVPQLATLILQYNKQPNVKPIKLKSIALGNPLLDLDISVLTGDFMWSHGAISDETLMLEKTVCNGSTYLRELVNNQESKGCNDVFNRVNEEFGDIDSGDLLLPSCLTSTSAQQFKLFGKHGKMPNMMVNFGASGDPCIGDRIFTYLNSPQVQEALHANTTHLPFPWEFCGGPLDYQYKDFELNIIPQIADLIMEGVPILLFSGDQDTKIPLTQTRIIAKNLVNDLKLFPTTNYANWYDKQQVGGWSQSFGAFRDGKNITYLTYATVRGAAHEVPYTTPSPALTFRAKISLMAFYLFTLLFLLFIHNSCAELIKALPGQPSNVSFNQYSGYIVTDAEHGRALFYYFAEAQSPDHLSLPLTLWLNGGPGCSSIGFGVFMEHGPFQPRENGKLLKNEYSWNLESNMLYVDSPIGVGYSYSNTSSDYKLWNDAATAEDNLRFIVNWFKEFPQYKDSEFFLAGDSYAGHYVPQLATLIMKYNKQPNIRPIKLRGIALGNPLLDLDISVLGGEYLWSHGAISDETLMLERTVCNDSKYLREFVHGNNHSQGCNQVFDRISEEVGADIDRQDLLSPFCVPISTSTEQFKPIDKHGKIHKTMARRGASTGDPCIYGRIFTYLNKPKVQKALHANTTHLPFHWDFCDGPLVYQFEDFELNIIPLVSELLKEGIPILLYSGDQDTKIPLTQTRLIANSLAKDLKLLPVTTYGPWYNDKQVGGWSQSFGAFRDGKNVTNLTFATVRGGAHEVPFTSPSEALTLFRSLLTRSPLPRPHN